MICPSCKQETEEGKFCTNCGAELSLTSSEDAATAEPITEETQTQIHSEQPISQQTTPQSQTQPQEPNQYVEKFKAVCKDFGQFSLNLIKRPSEAKTIDQSSYISGIITIVIFALVISLYNYISIGSEVRDYFAEVSFLDAFLIPLLKYLIMFGVIAVITFAAAKVALQEVSILDVIAKYGGYLVPFILLYLVHIIFNLISLTQAPFNIVGTISILGTVLIIPILILTEKAIKGLDQVYTIIAVAFLSYVAYSYLYGTISFSSPF